MRCRESSHRKLTTTNWQQLLKLIILQLHEKLPNNWTLTILWSLGLWNKLESWKGSISGFLMSWPKIKFKKKIVLKCHLLLLYTATNLFLIELWHVTKSGFYTTARDDQLSGWTVKKLQSISQSQTCTRKGPWPLVGICCLSDPLQLSESQQNHYIWEVCSAN